MWNFARFQVILLYYWPQCSTAYCGMLLLMSHVMSVSLCVILLITTVSPSKTSNLIHMPFAMWIPRDPRTHLLDGNADWRQLANTMDRFRHGSDGWDVQNGWGDQDAVGGRLKWSQRTMHWIGMHTGATWQIRWIHLCGSCDVTCSYHVFSKR